MNWFERFCRNAGLAVHHVVKGAKTNPHRQELNRATEESQISPNVTLRRTTIEEIELKPPKNPNQPPPADPKSSGSA